MNEVEAQLKNVVALKYGLEVTGITHIDHGVDTANYRVESDHGPFFVKVYRPETDIAAELSALELMQAVADTGLPAARLVRSLDGAQVTPLSDGRHFSIFSWIPGITHSRLPIRYAERSGYLLGRIHALFANISWSEEQIDRVDRFFDYDPKATVAKFTELREAVDDLTEPGSAKIRWSLDHRLDMLDHVDRLLPGFKDLDVQVIHGDANIMNMLFDEEHDVATFVDFRPPVPYFPDFEVARIAFDPSTVVDSTDWIDIARQVTVGYRWGNAQIRSSLVLSPALWITKMLRSDYAIRQYLDDPKGKHAIGFRTYWLKRTKTIDRLLEHLDFLTEMMDGESQKPGTVATRRRYRP